jgi:hypothetical protein
MYFDEAHYLTDRELTHISITEGGKVECEKRTPYYGFVKALDELRSLNIFSLFLSTVSHLSFFAPTKQVFASARSRDLGYDLQPPFSEMPFDLYQEGMPLVMENQHLLKEICTTGFMSRFGRPLYVSWFKPLA